ncbi:peptidase [Pseudoalteromonas luteoviolacea]|uniref:M14 family metallopeptidase n=1 Tax=Pseudoalteromonas luteoviolacea TaxID=43657 RepID=UPI001B3A14D4|nr:M14 family metallopeptidase [Pseudoalteromonas luteoviolacea]MBQ4879972.1 peptidase [Pseudoalteromonas luteoviolacea]MBQ4908989.1 peptidase [Pseudoalteromonas luteoviolacea]
MYMRNSYKALSIAIASTLAMSAIAADGVTRLPTELQGLNYNKPLVEGKLSSSIPTPESILGFPVGQRAATPAQITEALAAWQKVSDRMQVVEYAQSHEGRPLHYVVISSAKNLANTDQIKSDLARLANPVNLSSSEEKRIIDRLPAVSWLAYTIHGNEASGSDAALAAIYQLIASQEQDIETLLDKSVIIIDPLMNPDGRARFTKQLQQRRGVAPNVDTQSTLHTDAWATGRSNHYFFDLNRDFTLGVHPETQGIVRSINEWNPQLMIDAHEMGSMDSYLFGLAREPVNKNLSSHIRKWGTVFEQDQADALDNENWPYYMGEWLENLYPGYSSYAAFRGTIHILYEQARIKEDGVMQPNGRIVSYAEGVDKQLVSSIANMKTLAKHSKDIYRDFVKDKRQLISKDSPFADQTFAILPTENHQRMAKFVNLMQLQGFELHQSTQPIKVSKAKNQLGEQVKTELPVGTLLIRNRQSQGRLVSAMLEFDARITDEVLVEERQRLLRNGSSLMYDATAWNISMMYGLEALTVKEDINEDIRPYEVPEQRPPIIKKENALAYVIDGQDDASVGFAARLMERGVTTRIINKETVLDDVNISRGSIIVSRYDNEFFAGDLDAVVEKTAKEMHVTAHAVAGGHGEGDLPDFGGSHFKVLTQPRIAILNGSGVSSLDFGAIWHSIDSNLGIRHSHIDSNYFNRADLRRYNTLVLPSTWRSKLGKRELSAINNWVESGGTLIAIDGSVPQLTNPKAKLSQVREIKDAFKEIEQYDIALQREWLAQQNSYPEISNIWQHNAVSTVNYPWDVKAKPLSEKQLKKQDEWLAQFRTSGAIVAARTDQKHWLTFGAPPVIPVLTARDPILMSKGRVETAVRFGSYQEMDASAWKKHVKEAKDKPVSRKVGWATLPQKQELTLRMSGLLWPEASKRLANSAYLTRERKGNGQIILFSGQPVFRGSTLATNRLLLNAIVYGSGLGAHTPITKL